MVTAIRKTSDWPLIVQFACALVVIAGGFLIQFPLEAKAMGDPFAVFLACVFMIALMFGRPSGFLAVGFSSLLSLLYFEPSGSLQLTRVVDLFQIELYAVLAAGAVIMADQIRRTLITQSDANIQLATEDSKKTLQLREVAHRIANNFASLDLLIRQRAKASQDPKIQFAFEQASELVHVVARLNNRLNLAAGESSLDSRVFVSDLCKDLQACARAGVTVECSAERHDIALTAAVPLGLIINELVTNSLKYAFPDQRPGLIRIIFVREDDRFILVVEDNGVGMSGSVKGGGLGLHLLQGFSRALKGHVDISSTSSGTSTTVTFEASQVEIRSQRETSAPMIH